MSGAGGSNNGEEPRDREIYNFRLDSARRNLELLTSLHTSLRARNRNLALLAQELSADRSKIRTNLQGLKAQISSLSEARALLSNVVDDGTPGLDEITTIRAAALRYVDQLNELIGKAGEKAREIKVRHFEPAETDSSHNQLIRAIKDGWEELESLERDKSSTLQHRWGEIPKLSRYWTEYLDFVAGLSLRHENLDRGLSDVAEAMTRELQRHSQSLGALTIPGREGSLGILSKIVYLRFPEWTVWSLPLAARELWLIAVESKADIARTFYTQAAELRNSPEAYEFADKEERSLRPGKVVKPLLADAFATFTIGPAYAWSELLLGLDPADPEKALRAQAIFYTLDRLVGGANGNALVSPLMKDRQELERFWHSAVEQAGGKVERLHTGMSAWLDALLDHLQSLQKLAFSTEQWDSEREKWISAFTFEAASADAQEAQIEVAKVLEALEVKSIRFALNAAWKARLTFPKKADQIASRCYELCRKVAMNDAHRGPDPPSDSQQRWKSGAP